MQAKKNEILNEGTSASTKNDSALDFLEHYVRKYAVTSLPKVPYWEVLEKEKDILAPEEVPKEYQLPFWKGLFRANLYDLHPLKTKFLNLMHKIHYLDNQWLKTGYRQMPNKSMINSFSSMFSLSNEFVNIWSHFIPGLIWIAIFFMMIYYRIMGAEFLGLKPEMPFMDWFVFLFHAIGSIDCMMSSTFFHSVRAHSIWGYHFSLYFDFNGIVALVGTANVLVTYYEFRCYPVLRAVVLVYQAIYFIINMLIIPFINKYRYTNFRTFIFFIFGATAGAVMFTKLVILQWGQYPNDKFKTLPGLTNTYIMVLISLVIRTLKYPERSFPKIFDIFGASHQWFHFLTGAVPFYVLYSYVQNYNKGNFDYCLIKKN